MLVHAILLVWVVRDPFGLRRFKKDGKMRYVHTTTVVLAAVLPLVGSCMLLRDGYVVTFFPALACVGRNLDMAFYAFTLPLSLVVGTVSSILLIFFWTLFKVRLLL